MTYSDREIVVTSPRDGSVVGVAGMPTPHQVETAVAAADGMTARLSAEQRAAALDHISKRLSERAGEFAALIGAENGKPEMWARAEVTRAVSTFRWAAEEARRDSGELMRLDTDAASAHRLALIRRFPKGPVLGITPFNFPLNLVAHKVAPAIAVGAPIIVKPAPAAPLTALKLAELVAETELPPGMLSVLPLPNDEMAALVKDSRLPVISFTGSAPVGAAIEQAVPHKHVTLELGGNAAAVVCADYPDLEWAAQRIALFGTYQGGQSCISVQRVIVHSDQVGAFLPLLLEAVAALDFDGQVGPLINEEAAIRVDRWVHESGGRILAGGTRDRNRYQPTVLTDVPPTAKVVREEVFGPVLVASVADSDDEAFSQVNDSAYGLQAGVFTHNLRTAFQAHARLEVGGVVIGDVPSYRADQMPYGGVKGSGSGREGLRAAMDDYTDPRVLVLTGVDL